MWPIFKDLHLQQELVDLRGKWQSIKKWTYALMVLGVVDIDQNQEYSQLYPLEMWPYMLPFKLFKQKWQR